MQDQGRDKVMWSGKGFLLGGLGGMYRFWWEFHETHETD